MDTDQSAWHQHEGRSIRLTGAEHLVYRKVKRKCEIFGQLSETSGVGQNLLGAET